MLFRQEISFLKIYQIIWRKSILVFLYRQIDSFSGLSPWGYELVWLHSQLCILRKTWSSNFDHSFDAIILPDAVSIALWRYLLPSYITRSSATFAIKKKLLSSGKQLNRNWKLFSLQHSIHFQVQNWFILSNLPKC